MSVIIYISGHQLQILQASGSGISTKIQRSFVVPAPEGSVINGTVMDDESFLTFIREFFKENRLPTNDVNLVVNSSKLAGKAMELPVMSTAKTLSYIAREFADLDRDESMDVCCYTELKNDPESKLRRIYGETVSRDFLQAYVELFETIGIKLKGIYSSEGLLMKLVEKTAAAARRTFLVQIADDNLLASVLWVNGVFYYYNSQRCFQTIGTEEYFEECRRTVDQIGQFMKANQITEPIETIYIGGMERNGAEYYMSKLRDSGISAAIDVFDFGLSRKLSIDEVQGALMAICGAVGRESTNNLLKFYSKPKEVNDQQTRMRIAIIACVFVLMLIGVIAAVSYRLKVEKELQALRDYNSSLLMQADLMDYELCRYEAASSSEDVNSMKYIRSARDTYPVQTSPVIKELEDTAKGYASIEVGSFDAASGTMSFTVSAEKVEDINRFIAELLKIDLFMSVDYTGYSFDEGSELWDVHVSCIMAESAGRVVD
ncbi:MAG: hypothetical protein IK115_05290 [Lachnospiraceae bacterium]|nr:hypothetical protein [Lachnospiraceae bacterium]